MIKPVFVYFMKPIGVDGPIKIGSTVHPTERLRLIADWSPLPLEVIISQVGSRRIERQLHHLFAGDHSHHEWFQPSPALLEGIEAVRLGVSIQEAFGLTGQSPIAVVTYTMPVWTDEMRRRAAESRSEWAASQRTRKRKVNTAHNSKIED